MINPHRLRAAFALVAAAAASGLAATGEDETVATTFSLTIENDVFSETDQNYTGGTKASWDFAEASSPSSIDRLPFWARGGARRALKTRRAPDSYGATISLGQSIFTPRDTEATELIEQDRPYAGWTYLSLARRQGQDRSVDTLELTIGVVGPDSLAEDVQNWMHRRIGSNEARGWEHQLKNEIGGILAWRRDTRLSSLKDGGQGWGADLNVTYGGAFGNIYTHAMVGANIRFGYNLSTSGAPARIRPGSAGYFPSLKEDPRLNGGGTGDGFYLVAGSEGRYVARDIFVEGNTWEDSHGKERKDWVGDYYAGFEIVGSKWAFSYLYTRRSEEFVGQIAPHEFGSLTLSRSF